MRRTKHRRRFHTERVIANRQRHWREAMPWGMNEAFDRWPLPDGKLANDNAYFGCNRPRCGVCHWEKNYMPKLRRQRAKAELLRRLDDPEAD